MSMGNKFFKLTLLTTVSVVSMGQAKSVDCRVIVGNVVACNPYAVRFLKVMDIGHSKKDTDTIEPLTTKSELKIISADEMLEEYQRVEESLRFGTTSVKNSYEGYKKPQVSYGNYSIKDGDILGSIGEKFGLKIKEIMKYNALLDSSKLRIGQKLKLPFSQTIIDAISSGQYTIESGDTLSSIAYKFQLETDALMKFNSMKKDTILRIGKTLKLPLPYIVKKHEIALQEALAKIAKNREKKVTQKNKVQKSVVKKKIVKRKVTKHTPKIKKKSLAKKKQELHFKHIDNSKKHSLRVTATAYSSHSTQTDSTPFLAAWNNRIRPGMKIIAVSRDLLTRYGLKNGSKVKIGGLPGQYTVRDKMNKRYKKRIDIYMGTDRARAIRWGRRSVMIYW